MFGAVWSQQVLGFSAIRAGVAMLPLTIPLLIVAPIAGRLYDRDRPAPAAGRRLAADRAGLAWLGWHLPRARVRRVLIGGYVAMGAGIGMTISPATTDALGAAAARERSQASGMVQTVRQVGGVIGIAILGAIVAHVSAVAPAATRRDPRLGGDRRRRRRLLDRRGVMAVMALLALLVVRHRQEA